jgi:type II secretory pathway predicted ATPase ExeA
MLENHFALRENPFVSGHQPRFVYPSPEHQEALAHLRFGIENREPFVLITGEVGTGKTTALYDVLSEWKGRVHVALINNSALTRSELLEEICLRLGFTLPPGSSKPQVLFQLERHLLAVHARGERAILLLDEAQNLDRELLEEIRLLSNLELEGEKLLQVFLVGQPELEERLARPELRQLRQRISVHYRLKPLNPEDTERYIHHRISVAGGYAPGIFPADTCRAIFAISHGIPREINHICSQAMLGAFVDDARIVRPEHVQAAVAEIEFQSVIGEDGEPPPASEPPTPLAARSPMPPMPAPPPAPAAPIERVPPPGPPGPVPAPPTWRTAPTEPVRPVEAQRVVEPVRPVELPRAVPPPRPVEPPRAVPPLRPVEPLGAAERGLARTEPRGLRPSPSEIESLERAEESSTAIKWLLALAAVAALVVSGVLLVRFGPWSGKPQGPATASTETTQTTAPAETTSALPPAQSGTPPEPAATPPVVNATPVPPPKVAAEPPRARASAPPPETAATTAPPAGLAAATTRPGAKAPAGDTARSVRPAPTRTYFIAAGSFLDQGRAEEERGRLAASTRMSAHVITVVVDSVARFEIVLGSFTSQDAAERVASNLISTGLVDEARVVSQTQPEPAPR